MDVDPHVRSDDVLCSRNSADFRGYPENQVLRRILHVDPRPSADNPGSSAGIRGERRGAELASPAAVHPGRSAVTHGERGRVESTNPALFARRFVRRPLRSSGTIQFERG